MVMVLPNPNEHGRYEVMGSIFTKIRDSNNLKMAVMNND